MELRCEAPSIVPIMLSLPSNLPSLAEVTEETLKPLSRV